MTSPKCAGPACTCECCQGVNVLTPVAVFNRPGLDTLWYRVGTHGSFLETMIARLSSSDYPKLAELTTRDGADASIALLDAWATLADVLTFYQERIANEGYLRTATERRSVVELARLIGYRPQPGLSASAYLAYTLEPTQEYTVIEPGNKVQSLPGPGELPQVFETADRLTAYSRLNVMKPRTVAPLVLYAPVPSSIKIYADGLSTNLRANDGLLLEFTGNRAQGSAFLFSRVNGSVLEPASNRTALDVAFQSAATVLQGPAPTPRSIRDAIAALVKQNEKLSDFGLPGKPRAAVKTLDLLTKIAASADGTDLTASMQSMFEQLNTEQTAATARGSDRLAGWLAGINRSLAAVELTGQTNTVVRSPLASTKDGPTCANVAPLRSFKEPPALQPRNEARLSRDAASIYDCPSEFVTRAYAALHPEVASFVHASIANRPAITDAVNSDKKLDGFELTRADAMRRQAFLAGHSFPTIFTVTAAGAVQPAQPTVREYLAAFQSTGNLDVIALDAEYAQLKAADRIVIERPSFEAAGGRNTAIHEIKEIHSEQFRLNGIPLQVTLLTLQSVWLPKTESDAALASTALVSATTVYLPGERLPLANAPIDTPIAFSTDESNPVIELDGYYPNLEAGRWIVLSGERILNDVNTGVRVSELLMVASATHEAKRFINAGGRPTLVGMRGETMHTFLRTATPPAYQYQRDTVLIYGNVVRANHGETRREVLGSGDGSQTFQTFSLRQAPLTYLAASTPSGAESTLQVRVNDILWPESGNLFTLDGSDRRHITTTADDGTTTVVFGNGKNGVRPPTGTENVTAVYRSGIGASGNVKAGQLKLPMTKPQGVKGVVNPLPASGGADREGRDQARHNAPIATLALDRLVSVQDYADFSRTFAGISKADSQLLTDRDGRQCVHLTIAGAGNIPIDATSDLYRNLVEALKRNGDPFVRVQVGLFERVLLVIKANVNLLPEFLWEKVKPKIRAALLDRFGYERRELGEGVVEAEVLSVIQKVEGVNYTDLDLLDSIDQSKLEQGNFYNGLEALPRVNSELARKQDDIILPAQLLFLDAGAADTLILEEVRA